LHQKKQVDQQVRKIKELESEITKIKTQKITAQRKWKEETDKHNQLRKSKHEEILKIKKANLKKDKEIETLKKNARKQEVIQKRKVDEIKAL
jgi:hypothetical protein